MPDGRIIADDPLSAWDMARLGQGIAWAPHRLAAADIRSGRTVEVLRDWRGDPSPLTVRRRERQIPRRTHAVIALICEGVGHRSERERSDGA